MADSHSHSPATGEAVVIHDHSHDAEHVAKHLKGYLFVGGLLIFFTGVTVWLSYVDFDSFLPGHGWNIIVAMIVATFKAGTVAAIFMHLKGERITIWRFLFFTAVFVAGLFLLTLLHESDPIMGTRHVVHQ